MEWYHGKGWQNPSKLHRQVFTALNEILRKGQLKQVLQSRPRFEIQEVANSKQWELRAL